MKKYINNSYYSFINEAHIDKNGNIKNFDLTEFGESDYLWSDKKFTDFVRDNLDYGGGEMPEKMYKLLSKNHKTLYQNIVLEYLGLFICDSNNTTFIKDMIRDRYNEVEKITMLYLNDEIEDYNTYSEEYFRFSKEFLTNIDEILQGLIFETIEKKSGEPIRLSKEIYDSLYPNVKKFIDKYIDDAFIIEE